MLPKTFLFVFVSVWALSFVAQAEICVSEECQALLSVRAIYATNVAYDTQLFLQNPDLGGVLAFQYIESTNMTLPKCQAILKFEEAFARVGSPLVTPCTESTTTSDTLQTGTLWFTIALGIVVFLAVMYNVVQNSQKEIIFRDKLSVPTR